MTAAPATAVPPIAKPAPAVVGPGGELPVISSDVSFVEIEGLRSREFIPAAKEALSALVKEQAEGKLIRPVFNWAGRNSL
ncbi:MAG: hypothetical protein ACHQ0I_03860, partial [Candidatus Lutacidiplasmatales archaeon]